MNIENILGELSALTYKWERDNGKIVGTGRRGYLTGSPVNPITAYAYQRTGRVYSDTKKDTLKAATAAGLDRQFAAQVYDAFKGRGSNRGNTQVLRGKIRSYLNV